MNSFVLDRHSTATDSSQSKLFHFYGRNSSVRYTGTRTQCVKNQFCVIKFHPPPQEVATENLCLTIQNEQEIPLHFCPCLKMSDLDCTPQLLSKPLPQELDLVVSITLNICANLHFSLALSVQCRSADSYRHFKWTCCHHILPCRWRCDISAKYCCLSTNICGSTSQKTVSLAFTALWTSNFILHLWMFNNQILLTF
jgi:hypothetical protein